MKIFQIVDGFLHWDATNTVKRIDNTVEMFAPDIEFVEAPDYVFEGWGFDPTQDGDARFLKPAPPEGWLYDDKTGTIYRPEDLPADETDIWDELAAAYTEGVNNA